MKKFIYTLCTFTLAASFTSCEMKDELWGDRAQSEKIGRLEVNVTNKATISTETRATADDNGLKPGVFPAEEVDVNNYTLKVFDQENGETEVTSGLISDLGSNGKVTLALEEGSYTVKAYNYDGSNVNVSTRPYFLGTSTLSILPGKTTSTAVNCKLQNIEVAISLDQSFKSSFQSDYEITVDNGAGAIQTFTADNIDEISIIVITFAGLVMLFRVCQPFNLYRAVMFLAMVAACILSVTLLPFIFFEEGYATPLLDFVPILYVIVVVLLCFPVSDVLLRITERLRSGKKKQPKLLSSLH